MKLTIAIPTYNRAEYLREALGSVLDQAGAAEREKLEILVSDNASTDDTPKVIDAIRADNPDVCLRYQRHESNLGPDGNIHSTITGAAGDYVLILSDDDLLTNGALSRILGQIDGADPADCVLLNVTSFRDTPDRAGPPILPATAPDLTSPGSILGFLERWITFISIQVFRRELICSADYECRKGTLFLSSYVHLDTFARSRKTVLLSEPSIAIRENNSSSYSFYEVFVTNYIKLLEYAIETGYPADVVARVRRSHLITMILPMTLAFKTHGNYGALRPDFRDAARRLWRGYGPDPFCLFVLLPLLPLPAGLVRAAKSLYRTIRPRRATFAA